jgi:flagellar M-ring protein FliF
MGLVQLVVLGIVALVLGLFVVRPILTARNAPALPAPLPAAALPASRRDPMALSGVIEEGDFSSSDLSLVGPGSRAGHVPVTQVTPAGEVADPVARLRRLISERQDETVEILKSWMDDSETEKA